MADPAHRPPSNHARGIQRMWDPRVWGTMIGAAGATVFVMENRAEIADPWPAVAVVVWAAALLAYIVLVFAVPRTFGEIKRVGTREGFVYLGSVAGMVLLIGLGRIVLDSAGKTALVPALIVVAVGLHFLPFAAAFHTPLFMRLGAIMAVLGSVGLTLGWIWDAQSAAAMAVFSGIVMLTFIAGDAASTARRPATSERG